MFKDGKLWIANADEQEVCMLPKMANRHGLIAGATGTGKTVTLMAIAESFSEAGVPVFLADIKGDLAGMSRSYPVNFWDIYGKGGLPLRTTISEMGPLLLSRLMDLTKTQEDILTIVFKIADDNDMLLIDTKDLRAMLGYVGENCKELSMQYGNMSRQSINVIQRNVTALDEMGGDYFFGEPAISIRDWFRTDMSGKGMINILHCPQLILSPVLYSTFMLWMVSELLETLPEVGDLEKPKMVFFFDEAHTLFSDAPKAVSAKVEQLVKMIRSKGIGIYFITQSPKDIPNGVLSQLNNKVQHALRAYTPLEQKAIKATADSFRPNPAFDTAQAVQELGIGEALISFLQEDGSPMVVQRAKVMMPDEAGGSLSDEERLSKIQASDLYIQYGGEMVDRVSAYEILTEKKEAQEAEAARQAELAAQEKEAAKAAKEAEKEAKRQSASRSTSGRKTQSTGARIMNSAVRSASGTVGREIGNNIGKSIGGTFGKKVGGNVGATVARGLFGNLFGR